MPSDEEADFSPPARVANTISTALLPLAVIASAHVWLFAVLNPDSGAAVRPAGVLAGAAMGMVLLSVVMAVRLRLQGLGWKSVLTKALQQPSWTIVEAGTGAGGLPTALAWSVGGHGRVIFRTTGARTCRTSPARTLNASDWNPR